MNRGVLQRQRAVLGFRALGSAGTNAVPELLLSGSSKRGPEFWQALDAIGPNAMFPLIDAIRADRLLEVKLRAMHALSSSRLDFRRERIVEVWCECLASPHREMRLAALALIRSTRPVRAQNAIGPVEKAQNDSDPEVAAKARAVLAHLREM